MATFIYWLVTKFMHFWYKLWFGARISGTENIPTEGAFVFCGNHISAHDPVFVASYSKRKLKFMAKKELFVPVFRGFLKKMGGISVDRGNNDIGAVKASLRVLKNGEPLLIFPQGTRSKDVKEEDFKGGAAFLAIKAGVPIIPFAICGQFKFRKKIELKIGKPIETAAYSPMDEQVPKMIYKSIEELMADE